MANAFEAQVSATLRQLIAKQKQNDAVLQQVLTKYDEFIKACEEQPRSITQEIDSIPGRRIFYNLCDRISFTDAQAGLRGAPLTFFISQDGPFIATHYPLVVWKPNAPSTATNLGAWSPVSSWPLPTQQVQDQDIIDLSYEVVDSGSQRNFQNEAAGPLFSRPDNPVPLPVPTLFAPNTTIQFFPTFERIFFSSEPGVPTTGGELVVIWPGYKIANM
ncbi:MAG TPA: hypothetical protein VFD36_29250 [Kofleriaceae bacterium]|nr:hypothetical protein [Kofleriaceae bacterium]